MTVPTNVDSPPVGGLAGAKACKKSSIGSVTLPGGPFVLTPWGLGENAFTSAQCPGDAQRPFLHLVIPSPRTGLEVLCCSCPVPHALVLTADALAMPVPPRLGTGGDRQVRTACLLGKFRFLKNSLLDDPTVKSGNTRREARAFISEQGRSLQQQPVCRDASGKAALEQWLGAGVAMPQNAP